jgi:ubiquinone/menaquinone biosynthesis C-methylase UbiE
MSERERDSLFSEYFRVFPWEKVSATAVGADIGCGSGRWALLVAPRIGQLHCLDASEDALAVAKKNLGSLNNVHLHRASVDAMPLPNRSLDFAYSLGVLHHVPNTAAAIESVATKLKPGAPFLVYLYYAFDNRPRWYQLLWRATDWIRLVIGHLPFVLRYAITQVVAVLIYWPLARTGLVMEKLGRLPRNWPLAHYRDRSFYVMRTDALDRFGTLLEKRFTRAQIKAMLEGAEFADVRFSDTPPYWCAVAIRK